MSTPYLRSAFNLVAIEQRLVGCALMDESKFPTQVEGVL
jgi:hypothetical protein